MVRIKQGDDPIPVGPEIRGAVIDLGGRSLDFVKLPAKEIMFVPISPRFLVIMDKNGVGLAEPSDAFSRLPAELFRRGAPGIGVYLVPIEEKIVFQQAREFRFLVPEEIDLNGVIGEPVRANLLLGKLPVIGSDAVAVVSLYRTRGFAVELADRPDHFFV